MPKCHPHKQSWWRARLGYPQRRYVWRVAAALKWGFADFDSNVIVDRETLSSEEMERVMDLLRLRPAQFCIFLQALFGTEAMERLMTSAVNAAKQC